MRTSSHSGRRPSSLSWVTRSTTRRTGCRMGSDDQVSLPEREPFTEGPWGTDRKVVNPGSRAVRRMLSIWDGPATWLREKVVLPLRPEKPPVYYHQQFRRVPTVDECYADDVVCIFEAHEQYKRDRKVESQMIQILRGRWVECMRYHGYDQAVRCEALKDDFEENETNWYIKYGDVPIFTSCMAAYYKQVHRMIWERRQAEREAALQ